MEDKHLIFYALNMWANYIETGDVNMAAQNAVKQGEKDRVRALSLDQMKFIIRLRELGIKQLSGDQQMVSRIPIAHAPIDQNPDDLPF